MLILVSECNVRNMESPITFFFKGYEPRLMATLVIQSPRYYGHFFSARQKSHTLSFLLKNPVNGLPH